MNNSNIVNRIRSVADPGFGQGGAKNFFRDFADLAKRSPASKATI